MDTERDICLPISGLTDSERMSLLLPLSRLLSLSDCEEILPNYSITYFLISLPAAQVVNDTVYVCERACVHAGEWDGVCVRVRVLARALVYLKGKFIHKTKLTFSPRETGQVIPS